MNLTDQWMDQAEISGDLLSVLRELDTRIKTGIITKLISVSALKEKMVSDYPEWAIREILMNAVMHRDYQSNTPIRFYWFRDRIEIDLHYNQVILIHPLPNPGTDSASCP